MNAYDPCRMRDLLTGVCYYPEHWPEAMWAQDLSNMRAIGLRFVRVFEFAWHLMEPQEGIFDFKRIDRFLSLAHASDMWVILCTPTATPPAWLTCAYPETLNADLYGHAYQHGHRRHYNLSSPVYRRFCARIVEELASRYGNHPAVAGWQIDNEINCEINTYNAQADQEAYRSYIKQRFNTLDAYNDAIGAAFWNQTYTQLQQVNLPQLTVSGHGNPHVELIAKQFISDTARSFVKLQADIIREHSPARFITTNGLFDHIDNRAMAKESLDFYTYDSYPDFAFAENDAATGAKKELADRAFSIKLTRTRAVSNAFGIMEQQAGGGGSDFEMPQPAPLPGQLTLWAMQSLAHGARFISFFRWRTCPFGTEMYWHGLHDPDNLPNRRVAEVGTFIRKAKELLPYLNHRYAARVAILHDYTNEWCAERDAISNALDRFSIAEIFLAAQHSHTPVDMLTVEPDMPLDRLAQYKLLLYPHPAIITEDVAALLRAYCEAGGQLVLGAHSGCKDAYGRRLTTPGCSPALVGARVQEWTTQRPDEPAAIGWKALQAAAPILQAALLPDEGTQVLARFSKGCYAGRPAATRKEYAGGGAAYLVGSAIDRNSALWLLRHSGEVTPFAAFFSLPACVELAVRKEGDEMLCLFLNYGPAEAVVTLHLPCLSLWDGRVHQGDLHMEPFGVLALVPHEKG